MDSDGDLLDSDESEYQSEEEDEDSSDAEEKNPDNDDDSGMEICSLEKPCIPYPAHRNKSVICIGDEGAEELMDKIRDHYAKQATSSHVIILDDWGNHLPFYKCMSPKPKWTHEVKDEEGPSCSLCDTTIKSDICFLTYNNINYTVIYTEELLSTEQKPPEEGELQCTYCLNYFHRNKCSLSMQNSTYLKFKILKTWCCPGCVSVFVPKTEPFQIKSKNNHAILVTVFECIYKMIKQGIINSTTPSISPAMYVIHLLSRQYLIDAG
jgi:hypothetical protein